MNLNNVKRERHTVFVNVNIIKKVLDFQKLTGLQATCWHSATEQWTPPLLQTHLEQRLGFHSSPSLYAAPCQEQDSDAHTHR